MGHPSAGRPCPCGQGVYVASVRYSRDAAPVASACCFECGREEPQLGACCRRPYRPLEAFETYCRKCLTPFRTDDRKAHYCSPACEAASGALVLPEGRIA